MARVIENVQVTSNTYGNNAAQEAVVPSKNIREHIAYIKYTKGDEGSIEIKFQVGISGNDQDLFDIIDESLNVKEIQLTASGLYRVFINKYYNEDQFKILIKQTGNAGNAGTVTVDLERDSITP